MWKLLNRIFGFNYVAFPYGQETRIARLRFNHDKIPFIMYGRDTYILHPNNIIEHLRHINRGHFGNSGRYLPLTFSQTDLFPDTANNSEGNIT